MLPQNWYTLIIGDGVDPNLPGIYRWDIEGAGVYVGKFTHRSRPFLEYERNVAKMISGRPYRPQKPNAFRRIHRELHAAHVAGRQITLTIVENCSVSSLTARERELIVEVGTLNGREKT